MLRPTHASRLLLGAAAILILLLVGLLLGGLASSGAPTIRTPSPSTPAPTVQAQAPVPQTATPLPTVQAQTPVPQTATPAPTVPATPTATVPGPTPAPAMATATATVPGQSPVPRTVAPAPTALPLETPDPGAWQVRHTAHYDLYYLPGSPAAGDADKLASMAEDAIASAAANLQVTPDVRIRIYFVNRIFWQGGASYSHDELLISYPPAGRDYTSTSLVQVLRHETTHALVEQMLGSADHKGGLLGEGTAVWSAGGHYQPEPVATLASTLVAEDSDLYIPLAGLRRDFYSAQHEIAYLEGGSYVTFLVERWGLARFKRYLDLPDNPQPIYGLDSAALETAWRTWLAATPHTAADATAVRLRVRYYDLMRRYETTMDSDARILPDQPPSEWGPTLIGLFSQPAQAPANQAVEQTFVQAGAALWHGDLTTCAGLLDRLDARIPQTAGAARLAHILRLLYTT